MTNDAESLMAAVKANQAKLDACTGHTFERLQPGRLFSKFGCTACSGTVDLSFKSGYEQGLQHGNSSAGALLIAKTPSQEDLDALKADWQRINEGNQGRAYIVQELPLEPFDDAGKR